MKFGNFPSYEVMTRNYKMRDLKMSNNYSPTNYPLGIAE
jgi:hypothetical protein